MRPRNVLGKDFNPQIKHLLISFFCLNSLWIFASPVGASPDEPAQIRYSWAVVTGQTIHEEVMLDQSGRPGTKISMPKKLTDYIEPGCYAFKPSISVGSCGIPLEEFGTETITTTSYMSGYPPTYYFLQGLPLLLAHLENFSGRDILLISRIFMFLLCYIFIICGILILIKIFDIRAVFTLTLIALPSLTWFLFASINSSSLEIASSFLLTSLLLKINHNLALKVDITKKYFVVLGAVAFILATTRPLSWAWLVLLVIQFTILALQKDTSDPNSAKKFFSSCSKSLMTQLVKILSVCLVSALIGFLFFLRIFTLRGDIVADSVQQNWGGINLVNKIMLLVLHLGEMFQHQIGNFGWMDSPLPFLITSLWIASISAILAQGYVRNQTSIRPRNGIITSVVLGLVIVFGDDLISNFGWQGRYVLPLTVGLTLFLIPHFSYLFDTFQLNSNVIWRSSQILVGINAFAILWFLWRNMFGIQLWSSMRIPKAPLPVGQFSWEPVYFGYAVFMIFLILSSALTLNKLNNLFRVKSDSVSPFSRAI